MKTKVLLKEIKGVFKAPKKKYYLGRIRFGTPYFYPLGFNPTIIGIRKLKVRSKEEYSKYVKRYIHLKNSDEAKFSNLPMTRRTKDIIIKVFNSYYFLDFGWPIKIRNVQLGWKWKYETLRFEWLPAFCIFFFKWQFCIHWIAPVGKDADTYYEMILWWLFQCDKDIEKAEKTWPWGDYKTKKSSWDKKYLL